MTISRDEWLAALNESVVPPDPNALTRAEIEALLGASAATAKRRIQVLLKQKRLVLTTKVIARTDGRMATVPAFRLVKGKK